MKALFRNRTEAGKALAGLLRRYAGLGTVVLGFDRGGTLVAAEVAAALGAPLDLLPVQVFDLPCDRRVPLGAVSPGGGCVLDDQVVDRHDVETDAVGTLRCQAEDELEKRSRRLRGQRPLARVEDRTIVLVADHIASTLRIRAALLYLRQHDPLNIVLVAPVATHAAIEELRAFVNAIVVIETWETPPPLDHIYASADVPRDDEVRRVLGISETPCEPPSYAMDE